jgi:hypothetical protein
VELVGIICNKFTDFLYGSDAYSEGIKQQELGEEYLGLTECNGTMKTST